MKQPPHASVPPTRIASLQPAWDFPAVLPDPRPSAAAAAQPESGTLPYTPERVRDYDYPPRS
jgi:hypothetical protein